MDIWFVLRCACVVACCASGLLLSSARFRQWSTWTAKTKDHWWALSAWVFFGAYASIESIIQDNPGGSRIIVLALVVMLTFRALTGPGELSAKSALYSRKEKNDSQ